MYTFIFVSLKFAFILFHITRVQTGLVRQLSSGHLIYSYKCIFCKGRLQLQQLCQSPVFRLAGRYILFPKIFAAYGILLHSKKYFTTPNDPSNDKTK